MNRRCSIPLPARSLLPALLLLLALGCRGRSEETRTPSPSFVLKGTLVYEDGEPVTNGAIFVYNEGAFGLIHVGDSGTVLNPGGSPDSLGRFAIVVNRTFISDSGSFLLGAGFGGSASPITNADGSMIVFSVDPADDTLDLDRVMGSIKVRRAGQGN